MDRDQHAKYLETVLAADRFIARNMPDDQRRLRWVRDELHLAAAHGHLFISTRAPASAKTGTGHIAGIGIAFPLLEFDPNATPADANPLGDKLYGAYILVSRRLRGKEGMAIFGELLASAKAAFPGTDEFAYHRGGIRHDPRGLRVLPIPRTGDTLGIPSGAPSPGTRGTSPDLPTLHT